MTGEEDGEFETAQVHMNVINVAHGEVTGPIMQFGRIGGDVVFGDGTVIRGRKAPGDED
ncbi:hypothetical protein ABZ345_12070 [Lentzea sp. NPDC005914]|uniref:hypothetical protein n=1 Tax=Lentzea sp. NPDC005914 TaxID=3154572 RepID=UPI0033CE2747